MSVLSRLAGKRALRVAALTVSVIAALGACDRIKNLASTATVTAPQAAVAAGEFAFSEVGISDLSARMARGELSSQALTQAYLDRIAAIDDAGPTLNAVIELNPDALKEAAERDAERKAGRVRSPMHGIPVLLKDNIDATPMVNSAGSLALANHRPRSDAFVVARLRAAGAVILGKTNLSEWANFRSVHSTSGWSARGGLTRNPYVLDRSTCGSSSGTASRDRRQPGSRRRRHRNRRQHHLPFVGDRTGWLEADGGPGQSQRHHSDLEQPGHGRPDDAQRRGCCVHAGGDGRA
jgi:amidase